MINLLPDEKKKEIRAGRVNVIIRGYIGMAAVAVAFVGIVLAGTYVTLNVSRSSAQARVDKNEQLTVNYNSVSSEADKFRSNLATAKQILDKEVTYSSLILKIARAVPNGVVLDSLNLDSKTLGTPITLTAHARDKAAAQQLKSSFGNQPQLFSDVHFEQLQFGGDNGAYPVTVTLGLVINKEAVKQ
jgi:hypothetical protein